MQVTIDDLEELYRTRYAVFLRVAEAIAGSRDVAAEAVNEGFAGAIRARGAFRGAGTIESWVWSCVVNAARSARRREPAPSLEHDEAHEPAAAVANWADDQIRSLVARLPERQRLALFLRYYADLEYREIADVLGVERGTVSATLHKAHAALRPHLQEVPR
ncbi:MAG: sigma-70 family RNA polymerase sigma factor [Actinomycetota bacterium]